MISDPINMQVHFVDKSNELEKWIDYIINSGIDRIGADIEANSMYRYHQKICLLQLSTPNEVLLIDLQNIEFSDALRKLLENPQIVKVFQDMKYDLSMLWYEYQCKVNPVFDISIADRLIRHDNGYRGQSKLIYDYLGYEQHFAKSMQKSNWGIRPLSEKQIEYAASDVKYLLDLYRILKDKVTEMNLWEYFQTYMANIEPIEIRREFNPLSMWRLKGVKELDQYQLHRLHELVIYRNEIAKRLDRPIHWIIDDTSLVGLVKANIKKQADFFKYVQKRQRSVAFIHSYASDIIRILNDPINEPKQLEYPAPGVSLKLWSPTKENVTQEYRTNIPKAKKIKAWSRVVADEYNILPEMVILKEEINYCSSIPNEELEYALSLPGIPEPVKPAFIKHLNEYLADN